MTTIETNGRTLVVVEVPDGASGFELHGPLINNYLLYYNSEMHALNKRIDFHGKLIGLLSELTAEQCEPYAEKGNYTDGQECWKNYLEDGSESYHFLNAHRSFYTLLIIHGLDITKPLLIIEKLK